MNCHACGHEDCPAAADPAGGGYPLHNAMAWARTRAAWEDASAVGSHAPACTVHAEHAPQVWDVERHHIWPLGMGGPDVPANVVPLCPTGHTNVHALLRLAFRYGDVDAVPWELRRRFHFAERRLARMGHRAATGDEAQRRELGG